MSSRDLWIPALPRGIRARLLDPGTRPAREARPGLVRSGVSTLSSILSAWTARPVGLGIDAERILNFAGEGIYTVDLQGRCTFVNAAAASMLHTDVHVLLSRNIHQFHHDPDLRDEECPVCMPLSAGQAANRDDQFFVRGNGTRFPIEYTSTSIVGRGEVVRIVTFKDVSARKEVEDALRQSEMKFRAVAESANDAIVSAGPNGLIVAWNRGAQLIFGYTEDEAVGQSLTILMPAMYRDAHKSGIERFQMTGDPHVIGSTVQVEGQRKDGTVFPLELSLAYWDRDGERYFTGIIRDITERRNAELALQREVSFVRLLKSIAQASNEATDARDALSLSLAAICDHANWPVGHAYVTDPDDPTRLIPSEIWYFRDHAGYEDFQRATGDMPLSAGIGLPGRVLLEGRPAWISDVTEDPNFPRIDAARRLGLHAGIAFPVLVGQEVVAVLEFFTQEVLASDEGFIEVMGQIGTQLGRVIERERSEEQLTHHALHDPLTGLPNRALFLDRLAMALARAERHPAVAVLFLDVDRFKLINDSLGHEAGDKLLLAVTARLRTVLRPTDTVARFGGDEFVVVCEDLDRGEDVIGLAERLVETMSEPFNLDGNEVFLTVSVGIAIAESPEHTPQGLLRDADAALYRAKEFGRGRYEVFNEVMRSHAVERLETVSALHRALEREEFRVHYQPQFDLNTRQIVGVEALLRWQHPQRGLVPPLEFIPLAEETGLIIEIGRWVLRESCRQAQRWAAAYPQGAHLAMSVNISPRQLQQPKLVDDLAAILDETGFDPARLVLEITESVLMHDVASIVRRLQELKVLGVRLAIDDFGTGYSSLSYLRELPIDVLKIDKSFIDGLGGDNEQAAVASTIVRLAQTLQLETVAEGVERAEHVTELQALRCNLAQGYYFARPLEVMDFEFLLSQQSYEPPVTAAPLPPAVSEPGPADPAPPLP